MVHSTCKMEKVKAKNGKIRVRGMGTSGRRRILGLRTVALLQVEQGANSGVFYRTDKDNPVNGGFEIQLMDNEFNARQEGRQKLNGSFYDAKAPSSDPAKPVGEWNTFKLTCKGRRIQLSINGVQVFDVDVDDWDTAGKNPDGTNNKFKTALKDLPRTGRIGLQNHGQVVWFKDHLDQPL